MITQNLKPRILIKDLGLRNAEIIRMLDEITAPMARQGVKRNSYYMIGLTGIIQVNPVYNSKLIRLLFNFISACQTEGYDYLMIKF